MSELIRFIREFIRNKGLMVFLSILVSRLSMLGINIIAARMITKDEFGLISLVFSVFAIFAPLTGLGSYQGLLRYGVLETSQDAKDNLSRYVFGKGLFNHLIIICIYIAISYIYTLRYGGIQIVILLFAVRLLGYYFQNFIESYFRIHHDNKMFAWIGMITGVGGFLMVLAGTWFWGMLGYLVALAVMPWLSFLFYRREAFSGIITMPSINLKEFWRYSFHGGLTYFLSDILFSMDFMLIGFLLDGHAIAMYKTAIILPMSLAILPQIFMQTDYPKLALKYADKSYLEFYLKNYYKIFIPLGIIILIVGFLLRDRIIPFIFGEQYAGNGIVFFIILAALVGNMWLRNLYGNLSSAIGKAQWNTYASLAAIVIILGLGVWLIPIMGIEGAAIGMAAAFTFTGLMTMILFHKYLRNLGHERS